MKNKFYTDKIEEFTENLIRKKRIGIAFLTIKLFFFLVFIYFLYNYFSDDININLIISILGLISYLILTFYDSKNQKKIASIKNKIKSCKKELSYLNGDYSCFKNGEEFSNPEHQYSYDLDIFGEKSFFNRIDRTITINGRQKLASYLSNINFSFEKVKKQREAVKEIAEKNDWRIGFNSFDESVDNSILNILKVPQEKSKIIDFLSGRILLVFIWVSVLATISAIILSANSIIPSSIAVSMFMFQLLISIFVSSRIVKIYKLVNGLNKGFEKYALYANHISEEQFNSELNIANFEKLKDAPFAFKELTQILGRIDQRANVIAFILFNGLFLNDLILIRKFYIWEKRYFKNIEMWIDTIGEFDALSSMATYCFNNPQNTEAEIISDKKFEYNVKNIYHPFLSKKVGVANDFDIKNNHFSIVTGANMAGKSTFLRALGLNYIMAMNGMTVCASEFKVSVFNMFTSMRTADNLSNNISYFNAELIRLEKLIKSCRENKYTLIILDEILKGTNSEDKLKGSKMFLEEISQLPVSGVVATHDLELSKLENISPKFSNFCFEIEISQEIKYSYKISKGVAKNLNATYLLKRIIDKINN